MLAGDNAGNPVPLGFNGYTTPQAYDFTMPAASTTVFPKIDQVCTYHQIQIATDDLNQTAVKILLRVFEILPIAFWLHNAAPTLDHTDSRTGDLDFVCVSTMHYYR